MRRQIITGVVLLIVTAACGGGEATTTTAVETTTTTAATTTTIAEPTGTTEAPTTTAQAASTTLADVADPALVTFAEDKVARIEAAIPDDYTFTTEADTGGADDNLLFAACLDEDDFDLALIADVSAAAFDTDFDAPAAGIFGAASGSVEVRVFDDDAIAAEAFSTLEKILGTDEGRVCLGQQLADFMAADLGVGSEVSVSVEPGTLPADVAARLVVDIDADGIDAVLYWDLVASREAECTVFGVFQAFDEPFDQDIASTVFLAAFGG